MDIVIDRKFWSHEYIPTNLGNVSIYWIKKDLPGMPIVFLHAFGTGSGQFYKIGFVKNFSFTFFQFSFF